MASAKEEDFRTTEHGQNSVLDNLMDQMQKLDLKNQDSARDNIVFPEWLQSFEYPFLWHSLEKGGYNFEQLISRSTEKLKDLDFDEPNFSLLRFIILLRLVVEYCIINKIDQSWENIKKIEDLIAKEASDNNADYLEFKLPLGHVVICTKAHLLAQTGEEEKARKIVQDITPIKDLKNPHEAAMNAIKAQFLCFSQYDGAESTGIELMRKALELEPNKTEWEFLLAKILRQNRKLEKFSMDIPKEELNLLEGVVKKSRTPKYLIYLAQVYRECGSQAWRQHNQRPGFFSSDLCASINAMYNKSFGYYKEAHEMAPESPGVLRRVGYGIMNLPKKHTDYNFAKVCLLRSLELSENGMTLHVLGMFYNRFGNDNVKALEYFKKCASLGSHVGLCDVVRMKYLIDPGYNPCEDLEFQLNRELQKNNRLELLVHLGGFFLLFKRNLPQSIKYFNQVIDEDKDSSHMKKYKSLFLRMYETINLYEYIVNEALLALQKKSALKETLKYLNEQINSSVPNDEDVEHNINYLSVVGDFLKKVYVIYPKLMDWTPDPLLINKLHSTSKEIMDREAKKSGNPQNGQRFNNQKGGRGRGFYRRR